MINQIVCKPSMVLQTGSTINVTQQILYDCKIVEREQEEIKNEKIKKILIKRKKKKINKKKKKNKNKKKNKKKNKTKKKKIK